MEGIKRNKGGNKSCATMGTFIPKKLSSKIRRTAFGGSVMTLPHIHKDM